MEMKVRSISGAVKKSMPTEEAIDLLRRVCIDGEDPDSMEEIEDFRKEQEPPRSPVNDSVKYA